MPEDDFIPFKDYFDPVTTPIKDFYSLPNYVHPELIDREINANKLKILKNSKYIAIKTLSRPTIENGQKSVCSILQISNENNSFLVEMSTLGSSEKLDQILTPIFQDRSTLVVTWQENEKEKITALLKDFEHMKFLECV